MDPAIPPILDSILAGSSSSGTKLPGATYPMADSGQSSCYNETGFITCGDASFPGQDGDSTSPAPRSMQPPQLMDGFPSDYVTVDEATGLVWKTCMEGLSGISCSTGSAQTGDWATLSTACNALNSANSGAGYAGRTDWRMSSGSELNTLPNYELTNPVLYSGHFPGNPVIVAWTSSELLGNPTYAFSMPLGDGSATTELKTNVYGLRCVSGSRPSPIFRDNGNGTVTETTTGLLIQKCASGQTNDASCTGAVTSLSWKDSLLYCDGLTLASRGDWRLASVNDLKLILDFSRRNPAIDTSYFPNTSNGFYWTSTTFRWNQASAWRMDFSAGNLLATLKSATYPARCVAGP